MGRPIKITESERKDIRNIYNIDEQVSALLKRLTSVGSKEASVVSKALPVAKEVSTLTKTLSEILTKLPQSIKMPLKSFEPLKVRLMSIEGKVARVSKEGSTIKGTHNGLYTSVENVVKQLKTPAGSQFNLKSVINELSRGKSEIERILNTPQITKSMKPGEIETMRSTLMDINWSLGNIEDVLVAALKK